MLGIGLYNESYRYVPGTGNRGRVRGSRGAASSESAAGSVGSGVVAWCRGPGVAACALVGRVGCEVCLCDPCVPCVPCVSQLPLGFEPVPYPFLPQ